MFLFSLFLCQLWPLHCERKLEVSSKYFLSGGNININTNIGVSLSLFAFLTIFKERIDIFFKRLFWNIATFPLSCNLTSVPFNNLIPISYYTTPYHIKSYRSFWMGQQELLFSMAQITGPAIIPCLLSFDPKQFWFGKTTKNDLGKNYRLKEKDQARNNCTTA